MTGRKHRMVWIALIAILIFSSGCNFPGGNLAKQAESKTLQVLEEVFPKGIPLINTRLLPTGNDEDSCNGVDVMKLLVVGIDLNAQADAIRLVRLDGAAKKVRILSIPRDLWVPISDMAAQGIKEGRINATFGYGEFYNGRGEGIKSLELNLENNFGFTAERYLVLYFDQIAGYIDTIGGIDISLDRPVEDGSLYFAAGPHHFDGQTAIQFMRMRLHDSDFARVQRQSLVLGAFFAKVKDGLPAIQMLKLGNDLLSGGKHITNLSLGDVSNLICLSKKIETANVQFVEIPSDLYTHYRTTGGAAVLLPSVRLSEFVQNFMRGEGQ